MIADARRTEAYREALRLTVRPGAVVVDVGTGTGLFALMACRFGARKVYAIEPDDIIEVAREVVAANACADRVELIQACSSAVELPERADVLVSDLRGVLPPFGRHLPSIIDARERLLKPDGVLVPAVDTLWGAVVESPRLYGTHVTPWKEAPCGFDLEPLQRMNVNNWTRARIVPEDLLTEPACWAALDYRSIAQADIRGELRWTALRAGVAHGLSLWFDTRLAEDVELSSGPSGPELIYGSAFFPLTEPVSVAEGDTISATVEARLVGDDYVWRWQTSVLERDGTRSKATFHQSNFFGVPLSPAGLRKRAAEYVPQWTIDGEIDGFILQLMDGRVSVEQITCRVLDRFPARFPTFQEALARTCDVAQRYG